MNIVLSYVSTTSTGHAVAKLVEVLCYKPEGRGFESAKGNRIVFSLPNPSNHTMAESTMVGSASKRNEYLKNVSGNRALPARKDDNFIAICEPIVYSTWDPQYLTTL
jgi:hypothetical protein